MLYRLREEGGVLRDKLENPGFLPGYLRMPSFPMTVL
jgi:hypothetical protein